MSKQAKFCKLGLVLGMVLTVALAAGAYTLDDFESEPPNWWNNKDSGVPAAVVTNVAGPDGSRALSVSFSSATSWQTMDFKGTIGAGSWPQTTNALVMWIRGDGSSNSVKFNLKTTQAHTHSAYIYPGAAQWHRLAIPFTELRNQYKQPLAPDMLSQINSIQISLEINKPGITFALDDLAVTQLSAYSLIEGFDRNQTNDWWATGTGTGSPTLVSDDGKIRNAMSISFGDSAGQYRQVLTKNGIFAGSKWPAGVDTLKMWLRGDGSANQVKLVINATGGVKYSTVVTPGENAWHEFAIPFTDFKSGSTPFSSDQAGTVSEFVFEVSNMPAVAFQVDEIAVAKMNRLVMVAPATAETGTPFSVELQLQNSAGQLDTTFNGTVNLYATGGEIPRTEVALAAGSGTAELTAATAGQVELTAHVNDEPLWDTKANVLVKQGAALPPISIHSLDNTDGWWTSGDSSQHKFTASVDPDGVRDSAVAIAATDTQGGWAIYQYDKKKGDSAWSQYDGFSFWLKGDGSGAEVKFQVGITGDKSYSKTLNLAETGWSKVVVTLNELLYYGTALTSGDLLNLQYVQFAASGQSAFLMKVDDLNLVKVAQQRQIALSAPSEVEAGESFSIQAELRKLDGAVDAEYSGAVTVRLQSGDQSQERQIQLTAGVGDVVTAWPDQGSEIRVTANVVDEPWHLAAPLLIRTAGPRLLDGFEGALKWWVNKEPSVEAGKFPADGVSGQGMEIKFGPTSPGWAAVMPNANQFSGSAWPDGYDALTMWISGDDTDNAFALSLSLSDGTKYKTVLRAGSSKWHKLTIPFSQFVNNGEPLNLQRVKLINSGQFESAGLPAVSFTVDQLMLEKVADVRSFIISAPEFVGSGESFSVGLKLVDAEGNVVDYAGDCALEVKDVITGSLTAQENVRLASGQGTSSSLLLSEGVYAISASGSALGKVTVNVIAASSQAMLIESFEGNFGDRWWKNSASGYSAQTSSVEGYSGQAMEISFPATEGVWSQVVSKENVLKGNLWPKASGLLSFWAKGDGESTPVTVILSAQGGLSFISSFIPGAASWHKTLLPLSAFREKNSGRALTAADFPNLVYLFFTSSNLPAFSFSVDELAVEIEMPKLTVTYPDRISAGETAAFTVTAVGNDGQTLGDFNSLMAIRALNLYAQTDDGIEVALSSFASGVAQGTLKATRGGIWEIVISDSQIPVISTSLRILVSGQSAIAAPPEVISPLSQAVLAAGDQVTFSWKPVADAVQYLIELSWESDFAESLVENVNADAFTYVFTALPPGKTSGTLYWRIAALDSQTFSGPFAKGSLTILEDATGGLLESKGGIVTKQVFRPGQGLLSFGYFLTQDAQVTIQIRSLRGQLVRTIVQNVPRSAGSNLADSWDGLDQKGRVVPPGPYLVVLTFRNDRNVTVGRAARAFVVSK